MGRRDSAMIIIIVNIVSSGFAKMFKLHRNNDNLNVRTKSLKAIYRRDLCAKLWPWNNKQLDSPKRTESGSPIIIIFLAAAIFCALFA